MYTGIDRETGNEVAWKVVRANKSGNKDLAGWFKKLKYIESLKHPHVVNYLYSELRANEVTLIEEMVTAGSLRNFLKTFNNPKIRVCQSWLLQILGGLQFLHSRRIAHGKLSCSHIYLNTNTGEIKIGDLAVAQLSKAARWNLITPRDDIRNFGVCLLEVALAQFFMDNTQLKVDFKQLYEGSMREVEMKLTSLIKSKKYKNLVEMCLWAKEVDAASLKRHKFFAHEDEGYMSDVLSKAILSLNSERKLNKISREAFSSENKGNTLSIVIRQTVDKYEKVISFEYDMEKDTILGIAEEMRTMQILPEKFIWAVVFQIRRASIVFYLRHSCGL
eukprot:TRINITY_DN1859_c0_g1_i9.p1 TRINITY_DN1859_c0_g1~~TRINITY_DN1859_c0_g1_i9.p1  ORF type:complete len:332 (+),score=49.30 TRINITY_DN1859_c0_g1_i9:370-1365(+)